MEKRPNYLPATSIKFNTPSHPTEPSIVQIIFDDAKMAHVCYRILREKFEDKKVKLNIDYIIDNEIEFDFRETANGKWITGAKLSFTTTELRDFTDYVSPDEPFAVIFGAVVDGSFMICGMQENESIVLFSGYSGNIPSF